MECQKFLEKYNLFSNCCTSCHEDDDMGYGEDLWFDIPDDRDWHICCEVYRAYIKKYENN